ncbi:unnamed protein product, partial [Discosporangium mesarthrocarpum]
MKSLTCLALVVCRHTTASPGNRDDEGSVIVLPSRLPPKRRPPTSLGQRKARRPSQTLQCGDDDQDCQDDELMDRLILHTFESALGDAGGADEPGEASEESSSQHETGHAVLVKPQTPCDLPNSELEEAEITSIVDSDASSEGYPTATLSVIDET